MTYTTAALVAAQLKLIENSGGTRVRLTFDANSTITLDEINEWISEEEKIIDNETNNSWVDTNQETDEPKNYFGSYYDESGQLVYVYKLDYSPVVAFSSGTDKFEVQQDGATWTDLVATATEGDVPYEGDFYVNYKDGLVYQYSQYPQVGNATVRFTYRWGNSTVPKDIQKAATLRVAIRVLDVLPDTVIKQNATEQWDPTPGMIRRWKQEVEDILSQYNKQSFLTFWS